MSSRDFQADLSCSQALAGTFQHQFSRRKAVDEDTHHGQVAYFLHDARPEGLEALLGIAVPGCAKATVCRHPGSWEIEQHMLAGGGGKGSLRSPQALGTQEGDACYIMLQQQCRHSQTPELVLKFYLLFHRLKKNIKYIYN